MCVPPCAVGDPLHEETFFVRNLRGLVTASHERIVTPRGVEALEAQLLDYSSKILMSGVSLGSESFRAAISHARIVRDSEQYLAAHQDDTVSVPQLCVVAGVSVRTLRNAFQTVLGISPNAYIKARRLRRARSRLRQSSFEIKTVAEIAMSSGFWHLGNFARDYFEFFGERPSETLKASNAPWHATAENEGVVWGRGRNDTLTTPDA